jgi:hypothetical protein
MSSASIIDTARALCPPGSDFLEVATLGEARVLIPMANHRVRHSSLKLYPVFHWKERAYRAALRNWMALKGARFTYRVIPNRMALKGARFTYRVIPNRSGTWPLGNLLRSDLPTLSTAAVYAGIPGPAQKITVQLMDDRGVVLGFAKYADKPYTRALIANEAHMLEVIPMRVGPSLVRFVPFLQGELSVQTPLPGRIRAPSLRLDAARMRFLKRLIRPEEIYLASKHPFIESLYAQVGERRSMLEGIVGDLKDSEWPVAWMHGDLSPWNILWWRGDCLAFDWEHGRETGLAYLDAPQTLIQFSGLVQKTEPRHAKRIVSERLRTHLPAQYSKFTSALTALSALNMLVSWFPPWREPDPYERWLTKFVEALY